MSFLTWLRPFWIFDENPIKWKNDFNLNKTNAYVSKDNDEWHDKWLCGLQIVIKQKSVQYKFYFQQVCLLSCWLTSPILAHNTTWEPQGASQVITSCLIWSLSSARLVSRNIFYCFILGEQVKCDQLLLLLFLFI